MFHFVIYLVTIILIFISVFRYRSLLKKDVGWLDYSSLIYKKDRKIDVQILQQELIRTLSETLNFHILNSILGLVFLMTMGAERAMLLISYCLMLTFILPSIVFRVRLNKYR